MISTDLIILYVIIVGFIIVILMDCLKTEEATSNTVAYSRVNIDIQSTNEI